MAALVDTNVLVYRYDPRDPRKQRIATELLESGIVYDQLLLPHQALLEFVAAVSRPIVGGRPLLPPDTARLEADELLNLFPVLYPNTALVRIALRGAALYGLPWFDAHLWAFAEYYGLGTILSEDFQADRMYGNVRVVNPFAPQG